MSLRFEPDVSRAGWITGSDLDWVQLSCFGPGGFEASVRLFHADPDGLADDRLENLEGDLRDPQLQQLLGVLTPHTTTSDDCFFALWHGFGDIHGSPAVSYFSVKGERPSIPSAFPPEVMSGPRVRIPNRDYLLFRGRLADARDWGAADLVPGHARRINSPNLIWPADHAWFVATEIDQPWTAISGSSALIEDLLASDLDVEPIVPSPSPPYGR